MTGAVDQLLAAGHTCLLPISALFIHPREIELDALPGDNPLRLANPLLIRAELLAQDSARLRKAATELFEEHIERTFGPGFRQRPIRETAGGNRQ